MKVAELKHLLSAQNMTLSLSEEREIACAYAGDVLSIAMAHAKKGMAWITQRSQMTAVAIAAMYEMTCMVLPEKTGMDPAVIQRAEAEGIIVLQTELSAYAACARMTQAGVPD